MIPYLHKNAMVFSIPNFDHNHVLPPHLGDPVKPGSLSPYQCTTLELCERFAYNENRKDILRKFLEFRCELDKYALQGEQWLAGSFMEDIEIKDVERPHDLDLVTFYISGSSDDQNTISRDFSEFFYSQKAKEKYRLDHYPVDMDYRNYGHSATPFSIMPSIRYWLALFSHTRDNVWRGMVKINLNTPDIDKEAMQFIERSN